MKSDCAVASSANQPRDTFCTCKTCNHFPHFDPKPLTATLIKTLPVLVGSALRIPVGTLTDRLASRIVFSLLMLVSAGAVYGLSTAQNATQLLVSAIAMGLVGTTLVVGVQSISSWTPKEKRGLALGIFGAGNVGTAITTLGFPVLI